MTSAKKFELVSGIITSLLGGLATLFLLNDEYKVAQHQHEEFSMLSELILGVVFFLGPSLLVVLGSYMDAVLHNSRGVIVILLGSSFQICTFILLSAVGGYAGAYRFGLRLSLVMAAIVTLLASLIWRVVKETSTSWS
jgi:hypothetical protein